MVHDIRSVDNVNPCLIESKIDPCVNKAFCLVNIVIRCRSVRPCQIGILLSVNSSLTNLGIYSQKRTNQKRKHKYFTTKTMHYLYK